MSINQSKVEVRVTKCQNKPTCKTDSEINAVLNDIRIFIATTSFFFNITKYANQIEGGPPSFCWP
jgi:hypothetical protein